LRNVRRKSFGIGRERRRSCGDFDFHWSVSVTRLAKL
jgi:hypothetical protein